MSRSLIYLLHLVEAVGWLFTWWLKLIVEHSPAAEYGVDMGDPRMTRRFATNTDRRGPEAAFDSVATILYKDQS